MSEETQRYKKEIYYEPGSAKIAERFPNGTITLHFEGDGRTWTSKQGQYCDVDGILCGMIPLRGTTTDTTDTNEGEE